MSDRLPPHNIEAEESVLGGIIIDNSAFYDIPFLQPEHFYSSKNAAIFKAISSLLRADVAVDMTTLLETLRGRDIKEDHYVIGLLTAVPTSSNTRHYGRIVEAHARRRELIQAAGKIADTAWNEGQAINTTLEQVQSILFEVTDRAGINDAAPARSGMSELFDLTATRRADGGMPDGIKTGFVDIDRVHGGLRGGELIILAGRPGMGKSALEGSISATAAKNGKRIARFNLEMQAIQSWQRLVAIDTGLPFERIRDGALNDSEWRIFGKAIAQLSDLPMWIDDTSSLTPAQLHSKARRIYAENGGIDMITVDYLGLMTVENKRQNRTHEVGEISRSLKKLAKDLDIHVLALAQLNRSCESRSDKRPMLSDLRDSGDVEQDADVVLFIYRDDYYDDATERPNIAEVNIAKHRNGPTGIADLYFQAQSITFKNLQKEALL